MKTPLLLVNKIIILVLFTSLYFIEANAQNVYIPNANFKAYLVGNSAINTNSDTAIQVTEAIAFTGTIDCSSKYIRNLIGIEKFINITTLNCNNNLIDSLDLSSNTKLKNLACKSNNLNKLDVSANTALEKIECGGNLLITSINLSTNISLKEFDCSICSLTSLNLSTNTALEKFYCNMNSFSNLDLTNNPALKILYCTDNKVPLSLTLSNPALEIMHITKSKVSTLDVSSCTALNTLYCDYLSLSTIDVSANSDLMSFYCSNNSNLSTIDISSNHKITEISCGNCNLSSLNIANGNNTTMGKYGLMATNNPNLTCIQVDDVAWSTANWTSQGFNIDATASFSLLCNPSVENSIIETHLKVFPNPSTGKVFFETEKQIKNIEIYNYTGQKLVEFNNTKAIDVSFLTEGIYLAKITLSNSQIANNKIVISR